MVATRSGPVSEKRFIEAFPSLLASYGLHFYVFPGGGGTNRADPAELESSGRRPPAPGFALPVFRPPRAVSGQGRLCKPGVPVLGSLPLPNQYVVCYAPVAYNMLWTNLGIHPGKTVDSLSAPGDILGVAEAGSRCDRRKGLNGMRCPYCNQGETRVVDSRDVDGQATIRRRRECAACGRRFTTYERVEEIPITVIKRDGSPEPFRQDKLLQGLLRACTKRDVPLSRLEDLVSDIEAELRRELLYEVSSERLGEMVLDRLQDVDLVAYVRFASVYRQFESVEEFKQELEDLTKEGIR
ncbi:MAG: hypothetical protein Kow00122_07690 [Thermoleophilia bacterium]